jgi:hypothetical protein
VADDVARDALALISAQGNDDPEGYRAVEAAYTADAGDLVEALAQIAWVLVTAAAEAQGGDPREFLAGVALTLAD